MSLRLRVILLITLVLASSLTLCALLVGYQVRQELAAELRAAMAGARQTVSGTFEDLPRSDHSLRDLRQLVHAFDGNRHVRMAVVDRQGQALLTSRPSGEAPPPAWFGRLVEVEAAAVVLPIPDAPGQGLAPGLRLVLTPTPQSDARSAWNEAFTMLKVITGVALIGGVLIWLAVGAGLRPLVLLGKQFAKVGQGDYAAAVPEAGPPELRLLQRGFNAMTGQLAATMRRNRQLGDQIVRLQEEERAEIARDLHDEIGPRLFAVGLDAALLAQLCEAGKPAEAIRHAQEIQQAVVHMQGQVRDLLGWLRPARLTEFGLAAAIKDLVAFWAGRRGDIAFALDLPETALDESTAEVAYRVVQEALSNAMRHARPARIAITLAHEAPDRLTVRIENDGVPQTAPDASRSGGLGLLGMRERVEAHGGQLAYGREAAAAVWLVRAQLPCQIHAVPAANGQEQA